MLIKNDEFEGDDKEDGVMLKGDDEKNPMVFCL